MAEKERTRRVVPVGSYVDPNHPEASGGSVNFGHDTFAGVENHPLKHSDDYGATASRVRVEESEPEADDRPEDRSEWKKDDWKAQAAEYGREHGRTDRARHGPRSRSGRGVANGQKGERRQGI